MVFGDRSNPLFWLQLVVVREWENIVAFKSVAMSKAKLCKEQHCKRSRIKLQQEHCCKNNVAYVSLLQHVFFFFYATTQVFFFLEACRRK
jgi:hypothetical protein